MSIAVLFMLMASTVMLRAQEMDEKFAWTTQMFLNELKEQPKQPGNGPRRAPRHRFDDGMMKRKDRRVIARPDTVGGMAYISCFIHLKNVNDLSAVRSLGVQVEETFDNLNFITARVPVKNLEKLADIDNVTRIKVAQQMRPLTDVARQKTNVDDLLTQSADATAAGIATKYDGTGVILGIIDTGIDFQHIAFKDKNGNSRIKRAYVQTGATGTEYTSVSSLTTDDNTNDHGTHTASTAGGSSVIVSGSTISVTDDHANATYGGMAPGADLYLAGVVLYDTYIINALTKMVQYANAQNKPLVVSNSWGSQEGPHDGTGEIAEVVAQYFGDSHPNHIILFASSNDAGHSLNNEGGGFFVKKNSASSSYPLGTILRSSRYNNCDGGDYYQGTISTAWSSTPLNCKIHVLNDATGAVLKSWTVTSSTTSFSGLDTYYNGTLTVAKGTDNGKYYLQLYSNGLETLNETTTNQNGTTYFNSAYTLAIEVYPSSGSANVNMWANDWSFFSNLLTTSGHTWIAGSDDMCVSDEATIPNAISIGAYVSKTDWRASSGSSYSSSNVYTMGDIASFSSYATAAQSPTGQAYPWICAPGARLAAGVNHYHNTSVDDYNYYGNYSSDLVVNNSSSPYAMMEGTSMATPVAAGIVALWLQAAKSMNKNLTVSDVKNIMSQTAINDNYTTAGSNASHFGKGKIDALAGIQYIYDMQSTSEGSSGTWSGNTLTIGGNATGSGYFVPYHNWYKYSTVQMLYTPTEIGKSGTISSIAFKVANSASFATSEVKVYLGHKSSNFSGTGDYVTSSNLTLVYSGSPTLGTTTGWETLTFNQGTFNYNGTDNLVVVVTRKSNDWTTLLEYYYYTGSGYTLYRCSDDDATYGNVTNTSSSYYTSTSRPAIQMVFAASSTSTPTSINLNDTSVSLEVGKTKQLTATVLPSGASQSVTWSVVSGSSVASVSSSGLVTAKAAGTATIRATSTVNSAVYRDCTVTVTEPQLQPGTWSGNTLTIGDNATSSTNRAPYNNYWKYSTTQMLYAPAEIGKSGTINSIAFKVASASPFTPTALKVYLGHKSSIFSSTSDYVTSSSLTLVYDGTPTLGASTGWETLTFNKGTFDYNGTDNLVVVVAKKSSNYNTSLKYYYYTGSGYVLSRGSDSATGYGDITNTSAYSTSTERPSIRLGFGQSQSGTTNIEINATNFPDANFRSYLLSQSYGSDGILTQDEINGVTSLYISSRQISSLKGIEHFTALTYLFCDSNQLTTLDVSKNTALKTLDCHSNQLTTLDVSKNTALKYLSCHENQLATLDVSKNTALTELKCSDNQLTTLDVSKNTALKTLWCDYNQLTTLDVSGNTALTYLYCHSNRLTTLDVSGNTALTDLLCYENQLTTLDMSGNMALTGLYCADNQLTTLDVSKNTALTTLKCYNNRLTTLDVSGNTALTYLHCYSNQLTTLDVSKNTALTELYCYSNQLTTLDVSGNTALTYLYCHSNRLTTLDVSGNTALTYLYCNSNRLTTLDVSKNTALTELDCNSNRLTTLDVSKNTALKYLSCYENNINGVNMDNLIAGLRQNNTNTDYKFRVIYPSASNEGNVCTKAQVAAVKAKGWTPYYYDGSKYYEYEGSDETVTGDSNEAIEVDGLYYEIVNSDMINEKIGQDILSSNTEVAMVVPDEVNLAHRHYSGDIIIPDSITYDGNTYDVVAIADGAFADNRGKGMSVVIPNSVVYIAEYAFVESYGLERVEIPNSVRYIGEDAFACCVSLSEIVSYLQEPFVIQTNVFRDIANDATLYVPAGTKAKYQATSGWNQFTNIVEMEEEPNEAIEVDGLYYEITNSDVINAAIDEDALQPNVDVAVVVEAPRWHQYHGDIVIPASITYENNTYAVVAIDECAFAEYKKTVLNSVVIPNSVVYIAEEAFVESSTLERVEIPNSVRYIGEDAFADCESLSEIVSYLQEPFEIQTNVFRNIANDATLYVPYGTKVLYEATDGWNQFTNIVEMEEEVMDISQLDNAIYVIESYEGVRSGRMNLSVRIKNSVTAEGFDFDLILPTGFSVAYTPEGKIDAELSGERADENALRLLEPELSADGRSLHISASPANKDAFISGNDGEVMIVGVMVDANVSIGEHSVTVMDAEIHDREATYPHINKVQSSITVCDKTLGDANGNGNFNGADYTSILHYLWDRPDPSFVMSAADVNCDGYISVSDLTAWIYLYLNRKNATQSAPQKCVPQVRIPE